MADSRQLPAPDELEVSLFGPGVGECVVVHAGHGDWVVVDSCVDTDIRQAIALRYWASLGVDPAQAIRLVIVTHWHDDHIRGISSVVEAAPQAQVVCSAALNCREFFELVATSERAMTEWPGSGEFARILAILEERTPAGVRPASIGPVWAGANQCLWRQAGGLGLGAEIWALSPSAGSFTLALRGIADLLPRLGAPKRRLVSLTPNESAVVVWGRVGEARFLLGSDLETGRNSAAGWHAIVHSPARPSEIAQIFKIPHHGSANADDPEVWSSMLVASPHSALTPFNRGRPLPTPTDVARLRARTAQLYCTARPGGWNPPRRDAAVERTLKDIVLNRRVMTGAMGHVRIRSLAVTPQAPRVDLFERAYQM